jgi:lysophospholipase L1-like esterase
LRSRLGKAALALGGVLVALLLCELTLSLLLHHPRLSRRLGRGVFSNLQWLYFRLGRHLVQFDPACAQYDDELFYTLRPGRCSFDSSEFSTELAINHLGVRDSEAALRAPEIVAIGDSYTMGWGIAEGERFSDLLAKQTGYRVLNTGVSSYGTAREVRLLDRIDWSQLKYIVIQYDENDFHENVLFQDNHDTLKIHDSAFYEGVVRNEALLHQYYPGRYTVEILDRALAAHADGGIGEVSDAPRTRAPQAFINALLHAGKHPPGEVQLILFESRENPDFLSGVEELRKTAAPPLDRLKVLHLGLGEDSYFIFDDHLNPSGHARVARELARIIGKKAEPPASR